jgi:hypothetical protein
VNRGRLASTDADGFIRSPQDERGIAAAYSRRSATSSTK